MIGSCGGDLVMWRSRGELLLLLMVVYRSESCLKSNKLEMRRLVESLIYSVVGIPMYMGEIKRPYELQLLFSMGLFRGILFVIFLCRQECE